MKIHHIMIGMFAVLTANSGYGYEVWYGMPYMPKDAATNSSQWSLVAGQLNGINANFRDAKLPSTERNTVTTWKNTVARMTNAKNNALQELPRPEFDYEGRAPFRSLASALQLRFNEEATYGIKVKSIMLYNERPGENPDLPVEEFTPEEIADVRDWLDDNGHSDVRIFWNVRSNATTERTYSQNSLVQGILIEGNTAKWFANTPGQRQTYLKWAAADSQVKNKPFVFQVPFSTASQNIYTEMRSFVRWLSTPAMLGNTDFVRRSNVAFLPITYEVTPKHLPEKSTDNRNYVNSLTSAALSLIEQKNLFEGRNVLISEAETTSTRRFMPAFVQNPRTDLVYQGTWATQSDSKDSGGSIAYSGTKGNKVSYTFTGDRVMVGVRKGAFGGICDVKVDGVLKANNINTKTTSPQYQSVIYDSGLLSYGSHTVELVSEGSGNTMFDFFYIER